MTVQVTLSLSEALIEHAKQLGSATQRDIEAVLKDALEILSLTWESVPNSNLYSPVSSLTDSDATINQTNNVTQKPLAEAAAAIQNLLKQLEKTNSTATEYEQIAYVNIATEPELKQRAIAALQQGGETAIDEFVLENKYLKVIKAIAKGWLQPNI